MKEFFTWRSAILQSKLQSTTRHVLLTLSCHMNDAGESCFPSIKLLCDETGLSNRTVITHLQIANDLGWIITDKHGFGGQSWARNEYTISWPKAVKEVHCLTEKAVNLTTEGSEPDDKKAVKEVHTNTSVNSSYNSSPTSPRTKFSEEDMVCAKWIFEKIKKLQPERKEPNFKKWANSIRMIVEIDKRTHRDICELFSWANSDSFWCANILSPDKLRTKWDDLQLRRRSNGKTQQQSQLGKFERTKQKIRDWEAAQSGTIIDGELVGPHD